jgi:hypothetical protein
VIKFTIVWKIVKKIKIKFLLTNNSFRKLNNSNKTFRDKKQMASPQKFQFANRLGVIREEGVFSTIEFTKADQTNGLFAPFNTQYVKLKLHEDIAGKSARGQTITLVEEKSNAQFLIPAGSVIHQVVVSSRADLGSDLSFLLGYFSEEVSDNGRLAQLAQRCAGLSDQITGNLLNERKNLYIDQHLTSESLAAQNLIYDAEHQSSQGSGSAVVDYKVVHGQSYVAESKSLYPAITVVAGDLHVDDIDFFVQYTPSA